MKRRQQQAHDGSDSAHLPESFQPSQVLFANPAAIKEAENSTHRFDELGLLSACCWRMMRFASSAHKRKIKDYINY